MPVVMISTLTEKGSQATMQAMASGAVEIITKPKVGLKGFLEINVSCVVALLHNVSSLQVHFAKECQGHSIPGLGGLCKIM